MSSRPLATASAALFFQRCCRRFVLGGLLFQQVLIGDRNGDLSLYLQQLVLHIEDELFEHLLRVFRLVDQIVEVGAEKSGDAFHECHGLYPFVHAAVRQPVVDQRSGVLFASPFA